MTGTGWARRFEVAGGAGEAGALAALAGAGLSHGAPPGGGLLERFPALAQFRWAVNADGRNSYIVPGREESGRDRPRVDHARP